jgi:hypothetical protein
VARQHVADGAALLELGVKRVDGGTGHAEGLRHAFLFHHQHRGHRGLHLGHALLLVSMGADGAGAGRAGKAKARI